MSLWVTASVCWSTCWSGSRSSHVRWKSRWGHWPWLARSQEWAQHTTAHLTHNHDTVFCIFEERQLKSWFCVTITFYANSLHYSRCISTSSLCPSSLQVLKILLHLCGHGPPHLLTELRRNATFIQEVIGECRSLRQQTIFITGAWCVCCALQQLTCLLFTHSVSVCCKLTRAYLLSPDTKLADMGREREWVAVMLCALLPAVYSGPPDPIHGNAPYQKARNTAQVRFRVL